METAVPGLGLSPRVGQDASGQEGQKQGTEREFGPGEWWDGKKEQREGE
jgi:hypothetical protein